MNLETSIAPSLSGTNRLTLQVLGSEDAFDSLKQEWDVLAECSTTATIFQTFAWQRLWWKHFAHSGRTLNILVWRNDREIYGIAPCFLEQTEVFGRTIWRRLHLLGTGDAFTQSGGLFFDDGPSDFLDVLALPGQEDVIAAEVVDYLLDPETGIDELEFVNASPESVVHTHIIPALRSRGVPIQASKADRCIRLAVPKSMDAYFQQLSGSVRRRFSQALRAYHRQENFAVRCVNSQEELKSEVPRLIELHQERWNGMGFPGLFLERRSSLFQKEIMESLLSGGSLWFRSVYVDGDCIAARLGFRHRNRYYDYLSGIDTVHPAARFRPGLGLLLAMIEDASRENSDRVEFLRGDEQYKLDFSSDAANNWNYRITLRGARASRMAMMLQIAKAGQWLSFLLHRELTLLSVQRRVHGVLRAPLFYFKFRILRLRHKLQSDGRNEGEDD